MNDLNKRVEALELAIKALASSQFGAQDGHPFYGNQYTDGSGGEAIYEDSKRGGSFRDVTNEITRLTRLASWKSLTIPEGERLEKLEDLQRARKEEAKNSKLTDDEVRTAVDVLKKYSGLSGMNLAERDLSGMSLRGVDLSGTNLRGANLSDTNFSGANLSGADLRDANVDDTNFSGANLSNADLRDVYLPSADFTGANLEGAKGLEEW